MVSPAITMGPGIAREGNEICVDTVLSFSQLVLDIAICREDEILGFPAHPLLGSHSHAIFLSISSHPHYSPKITFKLFLFSLHRFFK